MMKHTSVTVLMLKVYELNGRNAKAYERNGRNDKA